MEKQRKVRVEVEVNKYEKYETYYHLPWQISRSESRKLINEIINDTIEEFECKDIIIRVYNEIVYNKGKKENSFIFYYNGPLYQNLINFYNTILN